MAESLSYTLPSTERAVNGALVGLRQLARSVAELEPAGRLRALDLPPTPALPPATPGRSGVPPQTPVKRPKSKRAVGQLPPAVGLSVPAAAALSRVGTASTSTRPVANLPSLSALANAADSIGIAVAGPSSSDIPSYAASVLEVKPPLSPPWQRLPCGPRRHIYSSTAEVKSSRSPRVVRLAERVERSRGSGGRHRVEGDERHSEDLHNNQAKASKPTGPRTLPTMEDLVRRALKKGGGKLANAKLTWFVAGDNKAALYKPVAGELVNYFQNCGVLTTGAGLCRTLSRYAETSTAEVARFFPRCYDMSRADDQKAFILDYRRSAALKVLLQHLRLDAQCASGAVSVAAYACNLNVLGTARQVIESWCMNLKRGSNAHAGSLPKVPADAWDALMVYSELTDDMLCGQLQNPDTQSEFLSKTLPCSKSGATATSLRSWPAFKGHCWDQTQLKHRRVLEDLLTQIEQLFPQWSLQGGWRGQNAWSVRASSPQAVGGGNAQTGSALSLPEILRACASDAEPVVQKRVERPLLLFGGQRFEVHQWVLIRSVAPLRFFLFSECFATIRGSSEYSRMPNCFGTPGATTSHCGASAERVASLAELRGELREITGRGSFWDDELALQIRQIVMHTLQAAEGQLVARLESFQLLTFDMVVDEFMHMWLLRVDSGPVCSSSAPFLGHMLERAAQRLVELVVTDGNEAASDESCWVPLHDTEFEVTAVANCMKTAAQTSVRCVGTASSTDSTITAGGRSITSDRSSESSVSLGFPQHTLSRSIGVNLAHRATTCAVDPKELAQVSGQGPAPARPAPEPPPTTQNVLVVPQKPDRLLEPQPSMAPPRPQRPGSTAGGSRHNILSVRQAGSESIAIPEEGGSSASAQAMESAEAPLPVDFPAEPVRLFKEPAHKTKRGASSVRAFVPQTSSDISVTSLQEPALAAKRRGSTARDTAPCTSSVFSAHVAKPKASRRASELPTSSDISVTLFHVPTLSPLPAKEVPQQTDDQRQNSNFAQKGSTTASSQAKKLSTSLAHQRSIVNGQTWNLRARLKACGDEELACLAHRHHLPLDDVKRAREEFTHLDTDGDNYLDMEGFKDLVRRYCHLAPNSRVPAHLLDMKEEDIDMDCNVNFEGILVWLQRHAFAEEVLVPDLRERRIRKIANDFGLSITEVERVKVIFDGFDADKTGSIDESEFKQILGSLWKVEDLDDISGNSLQRFFREIDTDGSGTATFEEFIVWFFKNFQL